MGSEAIRERTAARTEEWLNCLARHGYRLTKPRRSVVESMARSEYVLSPFDVFELAREKYSKIGLVTVYRTLDKMEELGLIQRVHRPTDCQAFVAAFSGHEHLLIWLNCGRAEFFSGDDGMDELVTTVENRSGYRIEDHWLQLFGVCEDCQKK